MVRRHSAVRRSHIRKSFTSDVTAIVSAEAKRTSYTSRPTPLIFCSAQPVTKSHSLIVLSFEVVTARRPSVDVARAVIGPRWALSSWHAAPLGGTKQETDGTNATKDENRSEEHT